MSIASEVAPSPTPESEPYAGIAALYRARRERFAAEREVAARAWGKAANLRLVTALVAVGFVVAWVVSRQQVVLVGAAAGAASFVALARRQSAAAMRRDHVSALWRINGEALDRLARNWERLPVTEAGAMEPGHAYAFDLDVFGSGALFQLFDAGANREGMETLSRWLLEPSPASEVSARQEAVQELSPQLELRQDLLVASGAAGGKVRDTQDLIEWAEGERLLQGRTLLLWAARLSPPFLAITGLAQVLGFIDRPFWIAFLVLNVVLLSMLGRRAYDTVSLIHLRGKALAGYAAAMQLALVKDWYAPELHRIRDALSPDGVPVAVQVRRLAAITGLLIPRSAMLYAPIQILTLWDVHVLALLERWQAGHGGQLRRWFTALGEFQALAALAGLAHDQPDWTFPRVDPGAKELRATALGHPLLTAAQRVDNDVLLGPAGHLLLVTGSNMSGKSTLLRAIGVNTVLAQAGAPVCAREMVLPPVQVWTSMRVQDSLRQGVSYFLAELQRLKQVVDAAQDARRGGPPVLFLLDEILHGTNTAERQIAAKRVILRLLDLGAFGAVSTHDLALATESDLAARSTLVHFTEYFERGPTGARMTFDYFLRPGIATSTNALKLMEIIGLSE